MPRDLLAKTPRDLLAGTAPAPPAEEPRRNIGGIYTVPTQEDLLRQTGLAMRTIGAGAADMVSPFTNPIRNIANKLGANIPRIEDSAQQVMTGAGLPEPGTEQEQLAQRLGRVETGVMAGGGINRLISNRFGSQSTLTTPREQVLNASRREGYVVPPATARPTALNRAVEGVGGKLTTAQMASSRNQATTNRLAKRALGLDDDLPLTKDALETLRDEAGEVYRLIGKSGDIVPDRQFSMQVAALTRQADEIAAGFPKANVGARNEIRSLAESLMSPNFSAKSAMEYLKQLRSDASANLSFSASADPARRALGRAQKQAANIMEDMIMRHLRSNGREDLASSFDRARQLIAQTYTVQSALNEATGNVSATKLARQLASGKPLSGDLRLVGQFGEAFPKAAREFNESMPGLSPLDWYGASGVTAVTGSPAAMAMPLIRPAARGLALGPMQRTPTGYGQLPRDLAMGGAFGATGAQ